MSFLQNDSNEAICKRSSRNQWKNGVGVLVLCAGFTWSGEDVKIRVDDTRLCNTHSRT